MDRIQMKERACPVNFFSMTFFFAIFERSTFNIMVSTVLLYSLFLADPGSHSSNKDNRNNNSKRNKYHNDHSTTLSCEYLH